METNEKTGQSEYENNSPKKINNKGLIIGIVIAAVIALAVGIGFSIYNSPENCMSRQLDLGQKYLEEQNYEQAIVAFNEVIEIDDRCLEAYLGGMKAYAMLGDTENQKVLYEKALGKVREFSAEEIEADRENVVVLYLEAEAVYAGEDEKILEILQEGYELTGDERLDNVIEKLQVKIKETFRQKRGEVNEHISQLLLMGHRMLAWGEVYWTYEQIEKELSPYIEFLEKYKELFPDDVYSWDELEKLYYMAGDYEACLNIRKQIYEITGNERYSIEGYVDNSDEGEYTRDEFGRNIYKIEKADPHGNNGVVEWEYDNGRMIRMYDSTYGYNEYSGESFEGVQVYEYDMDGRIVKKQSEEYNKDNGKLESVTIFTFEYIEQGCKLHACYKGNDINVEGDYELIIDEYGFATNWDSGNYGVSQFGFEWIENTSLD